MAREKTAAETRAWIAETNRLLDEVEKMDPNDPALAPWQTENWRRKGEGMLAGLKPVAVVVLLALGGCTQGWLADWAPDQAPHSSTYVPGQGIVRTYHYGITPRDPLGSVHEFRPDIYRRFYGPR